MPQPGFRRYAVGFKYSLVFIERSFSISFMHLSIWREKTRAAAKYLLSLMTCTERDKDIKYMMGLIRNTNLNTDLAMLTHHLNELIAKDDMARDAADKASYEPQDQKATHRLRNYLD